MKKNLTIILVIEFVICMVFGSVTTVERRDQIRAFGAWHQNPTPQTRAELDRQIVLTERYLWGFSIIVFFVIAGLTIGGMWFWRRL